MNIELLHIGNCPSWIEAGARLREALSATGFDGAEISCRLVTSAQDASQVSFAGSPTILLRGEDLFPGASGTSDLACRVYATPTGRAGLPTTEQIIDAIASHGR